MLSYQADADTAGGTTVFRTPVVAAAIAGRKIQLRTGGSEAAELEADLVVNAAGLDAWDFSAGLSGLDRTTIPPKYLAKGNYFTLTGTRAPFRHLIYPVPGARRSRHPLDARSGGPGPLWSGRRMGGPRRLRGRSERGESASTPPFAATGPAFPMAFWRPLIRGSGRKRPRRGQAISSSKGPRIRDIRATYRCTGLSLQGSPRLSPSASTWPSLPGSPREMALETVPGATRAGANASGYIPFRHRRALRGAMINFGTL